MSLRPLVGVLSLLTGLVLYLVAAIVLSTAQTTIHLLDPAVYVLFATVFAANAVIAFSGKKPKLLTISALAFFCYCAWKVFNEYRLTNDLGFSSVIFMAFGAASVLIALLEFIANSSKK